MSTVDFGLVRWRKSSRSSGDDDHTDCVELAHVDSLTGVRDSKNPTGPVLTIPGPGWCTFLSVAKSGES
jgi:hypothetical protein